MTSPFVRQFRDFVGLYNQHVRRHLNAQGIQPQKRILLLLMNRGPMTQAELGRIVGFDKSWVSRMTDRFVDEGLVEREHSEQDRRSVLLNLTPQGSELAERIDTLLNEFAEHMFGDIPPDKQEKIACAFNFLTEILWHRGPRT